MSDKVRMEIRVDADVYKRLKGLADTAGLSLNQLMAGVSRWASLAGTAGRPVWDEDLGLVNTTEEPDVVWFGRNGWRYDEDRQEYFEAGNGDVAFVIDHTGRATVIDGQRYDVGRMEP